MTSENGTGVQGKIRFSKLDLPGFDVYWAGDGDGAPGSYCFGSGDGSLLFTEPGCPLRTLNHLVPSREAINEVAFLDDWLAASTRGDVVFANKNGPTRTWIGGAHGVIATRGAVEGFLAPMGVYGILWVDLGHPEMGIYPTTLTAEEHDYNFYRIVGLHCPVRGGLVACAARHDGFGGLPMPGQETPATWLRPEGVDFVDVTALDPERHPFAVAALGVDCSIRFVRDLLTDLAVEVLDLNLPGERGYQLFCSEGHILLLTNRRLYVFKDLATRFLEGQPIGEALTLSWLELEAVSASLVHDRSLLVVMADSVLRFELDSLTAPVGNWAAQPPEHSETTSLIISSCQLGRIVVSQDALNPSKSVLLSSSASDFVEMA